MVAHHALTRDSAEDGVRASLTIKLGFSYFLFTGGYGARCACNHSAKLVHHAVRRHCNDWIVLNDKDAHSLQLHTWFRFLGAAFLLVFS